MKSDEKKKCRLKIDKIEHVLLDHFLNHTQILSLGKKVLIRPHMAKR